MNKGLKDLYLDLFAGYTVNSIKSVEGYYSIILKSNIPSLPFTTIKIIP